MSICGQDMEICVTPHNALEGIFYASVHCSSSKCKIYLWLMCHTVNVRAEIDLAYIIVLKDSRVSCVWRVVSSTVI